MKERVSTFLDGELTQDESEQLIRKLDEDAGLRSQWRRYNIYGVAMRDELSAAISSGFSDRVLQALANEPVQLAPASLPRKKRLGGPVVGFAVAASLLVIAVLIQKPAVQESTETGLASISNVSAPAPLPVKQALIGDDQGSELIVANSKNQNIRERINRLLVEHNEYNPASDMTGIWSYSRFVGYNPSTDAH